MPPAPSLATSILLTLLGLIALAFVYLLIALVEMTVLQLLKWGDFRQSLRAALRMNVYSSLLGVALLIAFQQPPVWGLLPAWALSVAIETWALTRLRPGAAGANGLAALLANASSYLLIILPAYLQR